ncbi:MAG: VOC family protein [Noviherbaspirillum sp.]
MIRYKRLAYLALNVSDLDRSVTFYRDVMGLQHVGPAEGETRFLRCSDKHHDIVLYQGNPGLKRIAFELESADELPKLRQALSAAQVGYRDIPEQDRIGMRTGEGIRMMEPHTRATMDFFVAGDTSDDYPPYAPSVAKILRLGHLVLKAAQYRETVDFFEQVLNFRVSDKIGEAVTFMRCFPNPLHHSFGISNGNGENSLHHLNFMVTDIDDIGLAMWRFKRLEVPIVFGPGRHPTSNSIFLYALDPDGITVEYSFGMEEFPERDAREPRQLPPGLKSIDSWEGPVDPRKNGVGTIEVAALE